MAWRCSATTNEALVQNLIRANLVTKELAIRAMKGVDRGLFVIPQHRSAAYEDCPLPIGYDVTISAPHMHAMMLDLMAPLLGPGSSALDIGSGSGYTVACMAKMGAKAYGIEHIPQLVSRSIKAVSQVVPEDSFVIKMGDGRKGLPEFAPYDVIHVGAAAQPDVVTTLMKQLKPKGALIIPVELRPGAQSLFTYQFAPDGSIKKEHVCDVRFVPLTDAPA
jgi:protein-L-isoaspartate(D-aspartate) O-methyltransferase